MRQKNQVKLNLGAGASGEARNAATQESEIRAAKACLERPAAAGPSMEAVVERSNLLKALEQVQRNKGAGVDGMTIAKLAPNLKEHWGPCRANRRKPVRPLAAQQQPPSGDRLPQCCLRRARLAIPRTPQADQSAEPPCTDRVPGGVGGVAP